MKQMFPAWTGVALAATVATCLAVPLAAQEGRPGGGGGGAAASHGGGERGGGSAASGGGSSASGGGGSSAPATSGSTGGGNVSSGGFSGGRSESDGPRRGGSTGGSGYAAPRGSHGGNGGNAGGGAGARASGGTGTTSTAGTAGSAPGGASDVPSSGGNRAVVRGGSDRAAKTADSGGDGVPTYSRPRDGNPIVGTAVPRGTTPPPAGGGVGIIPGGYYGGYYDPWWLGPAYGGYLGYGGYYGGYYDPWYGGDPTYQQPSYGYGDEGSLRLKIKPREAEVYVDGYFVGVVDAFDGVFQRLHIESGPHRIEVRAQGYDSLTFDVRITPEHGTTYQGELKRIR